MPRFKVKVFNAAVWDGLPDRDVEAASAQEAAEKVCGERLMDKGSVGQFRVRLWKTGETPSQASTFYSKPS